MPWLDMCYSFLWLEVNVLLRPAAVATDAEEDELRASGCWAGEPSVLCFRM